MKKIILVFWLSGVCFFSLAQEKQAIAPAAVSIDSISKLITYQGVVEVKGVKADELYKRIFAWFQVFYKNPAEVVRENDSIKFIVVGKPRFRLLEQKEKDGPKVEGNNIVQYTITIAARDGRFRYELSSYNWKQSSYYACERWLDTKASSYQAIFNDFLLQLDKYSLEVVSSLKNAVTREKAVKDKDNW